MGNQLLSILDQGPQQQGHITIKKSRIRPIKNLFIKQPLPLDQGHNEQMLARFSDSQIDFKRHDAQDSDDFKDSNSKHNQFQGFKNRMVRQSNQQNCYNLLEQHPSDLNKPKKVEEQIIPQYLPAVSRIMSILKPFEKQFQDLEHNKVKTIRISQDIYQGCLNDLNQPHGLGMLIKKSGSTLIGNFFNGFLQGDAIVIYSNGSYYKGKMTDSMAKDTSGEYHSQQMTYVGGFYNNFFNGACQQLGNDYYFKGFYENNLKKFGVLLWESANPSKIINQKGQNFFQTNANQIVALNADKKIQIEIKRDFKNLPKYKYSYEGQFDIHQLFTGKGKLICPEGVYVGDFYRGMKHGKGEYQYAGNIIYRGDYQNDKRSGIGVLINYGGTIAYEGQWANGLPNGKGYSSNQKGEKYEGMFVNGLPSVIAPE